MNKFPIRAGVVLLPALLSSLSAFLWWRFLPEPPFPEWLMISFHPIVEFVIPGGGHSAEELLAYLGIWFYAVIALLITVFVKSRVFRASVRNISLL
ncbi:MAG TPA: hypothetical protein VFX02_02940 [Gammaproteobacteria bacterium]|nr:hypothetical protein [Gammaproteobacteria bacterium]